MKLLLLIVFVSFLAIAFFAATTATAASSKGKVFLAKNSKPSTPTSAAVVAGGCPNGRAAHENGANDLFDFFTFSQQWPGTFCTISSCNTTVFSEMAKGFLIR